MTEFIFDVKVIGKSEIGAKCILGDSGEPFWLPLHRHVHWGDFPEVGRQTKVSIPRWLANKHRQLVGDAAFEQAKKQQTEKTMADQFNMGGALFKNDRKEKDTHPDYKGDITIDGRKYWLSAWIKEGKRGKYLSLAVRAADDQPQEAKPQPRNVYAEARGRGIEDEMPF